MNNQNKKIIFKRLDKLIIATILMFLITSSLVPAQIAFNKNDIQDEPSYEFQQTVSYSLNDLEFGTLMDYDTVEIKDGFYLSNVGKPMLPSKQIKIALPPGMIVESISIDSEERIEIPGEYNVFPYNLIYFHYYLLNTL